MQTIVRNYLNTIEVLCLLHMEYLRSGPIAIEIHCENPKESWILQRLEDSSVISVVVHLATIVQSFVSSPQIFKDLFITEKQTDDNIFPRIIEKYYLGQVSGLGVQGCAHAAAWAIPYPERPTLAEIDKVTLGLKQLWYNNCPDIEKVEPDKNFIARTQDGIRESLSAKTLVGRTLLLSDEDLKLVVGKSPFNVISLFLANLNRDDEVEFALFQRVWMLLPEPNQIDVALDRQKVSGSRGDALKSWENVMLDHGLIRRTSKRKVG
ncbi:hypothetical protein QJS83_16990 [Bdellovibrio sp. 22V]|uniref:hypothetical protein n=1 Tax=Bdellovibrio sp. 22V TaxID=3044166 RepID=UPI002542D064|nr:hypothetical protein [Bdellovibrio sp. 22V]WII72161.1 hypothetical protein QJS83_16990 [Bdellovibrio sp. 22V]